MTIDYAAIQREMPILKRRVTLARKKGPAAVMAASAAALARFDVIGWPDDWAHFQRAYDGAAIELSFATRLGEL